MQLILKNSLKAAALLCLIQGLSTSCTKDNSSYDTYFYLQKPVNEASVSVQVDGKNYGALAYVASPVSDTSSGTNHVKLASGRHYIEALNGTNKPIISFYIDLSANTEGCGSWGPAGGGNSMNSGTKANENMVGMFE